MEVFALRNRLIGHHSDYVRSCIEILDLRIRAHLDRELSAGRLLPAPLIQLPRPSCSGELADEGVLHPECRWICQWAKDAASGAGNSRRLRLHQLGAIRAGGAVVGRGNSADPGDRRPERSQGE